MGWLYFLLIGLAAGYLATTVMGGKRDLFADLGVGVAGAYIGGYLFKLIGVSLGGLVGSLITAFVGAIALLWVVSMVKKRT